MTRHEPQAEDVSFSLFTGDPLHRAQRRVRLIPERGLGVGRRIAVAVGLAWLPLVLWALWNRLLLPGVVDEPLLRHFGIHARFLIALPLFLASEALVERTLRHVLPQFISSGAVDDALLPRFRQILIDAGRLRDSRVALGVIATLVLLSAATGWGQADHNHELIWSTSVVGRELVAFWFNWVSRPIFLMVVLAWLWRLVVVARLFHRIAGLDLRLAPTHPDRVAGLAFIERLPAAFAPFFFGIAIVVASRWGHEALYHGMPVSDLQVPGALLVLATVVIGSAPMLAFVGKLAALKRRSLVTAGALLSEYGRLFERRWMHGEEVDDGGLLSAPEIGPVADTEAIYASVDRLRIIPLSRRSLVPLALAAGAPLVPVLATQMPLKQAVMKVLAPLIGL